MYDSFQPMWNALGRYARTEQMFADRRRGQTAERQQRMQLASERMGMAATIADTPEKWDQAVDYIVKMGIPEAEQFRGQFSPELRRQILAQSQGGAQFMQQESKRSALEKLYAPQQVGGPLRDVAEYQQVGQEYAPPSRETIGRTLLEIGDVENALQYLQPPQQKYQIKETAQGYTYFPEQPGQPIPTGISGPEDFQILETDQGYVYAPKRPGSSLVPTGMRAPAKTPASVTNVVLQQEKEEAKAVGRGAGEDYISIQQAGREAISSDAKYERLGSLLQMAGPGKFRGTTKAISEAARGIGLNIDPRLPAAQAAEAITNQLALEMRNPAGGAGMPGAMSDKDREFLMRSVPNLTQTPEGIKLLIEYKKKLNKRSKQVAEMARKYRRDNGSFDYGFYDELAAWSESHPMFGKETLLLGTPQPTQSQSIIEQARRELQRRRGQ